MTSIEWTDETWNPVVGCSPVSEGCRNCYAAREAIRLAGHPNPRVSGPYVFTAEKRGSGDYLRPVFTGIIKVVEERLTNPLRWKKPRRVFVNSMSDLFHPAVPFEVVDRVFAVMAITPRHVYQVLTKRPDRMAEYMNGLDPERVINAAGDLFGDEGRSWVSNWMEGWSRPHEVPDDGNPCNGTVKRWPLPNVWLGTSVEDQAAADERIPHLIETPAAVRFLSCEPLLGPVDLSSWVGNPPVCGPGSERTWLPDEAGVDWVIVGGESGPRARLCNIDWIRSIVAQCQSAGVPVFVKQLGRIPYEKRPAKAGPQGTEEALRNIGHPHPQRSWFREGWTLTSTPEETVWIKSFRIRDRRGADPAEWPEDLRVREWPNAVTQ